MIPKIIHYCWFGGKPKPKIVEQCIESWKKFCPDYQIIEWNETNYDVTKNQYMKEAYDAKKWGFVPDYARKDIIYTHGGIYLDTDVEIIKPIDELLELEAFAATEKPGLIAMGLGFGAEKGNPIIKELRDVYIGKSFKNEDGSLNLTPCLSYENPAFQKYGLEKKDIIQKVGNITVYPTEYFCPKAGYATATHITEKSYTIHHYAASWVPLRKKIRGYFAQKLIHSKIYHSLKNLFRR